MHAYMSAIPSLGKRFSVLKLELSMMDRGTFIAMWQRAMDESKGSGVAAGAALKSRLVGSDLSAQQLHQVYSRLVTSEQYRKLRRTWGVKGKHEELVAWLIRPAISEIMISRDAEQHNMISDSISQLVLHNKALENQVPCPVSCQCENMMDESCAVVKAAGPKHDGLFAVCDIPPNQFIAQYTGYRRLIKVCFTFVLNLEYC